MTSQVTKALRIAVADDEPEMLRYYARFLPRLGHQVVSFADDGHVLLNNCREHSPDLVITDIRMPRLDGLAVLCQIDTPFIIVSAQMEGEQSTDPVWSRRIAYLMKPIKQADLRRALDTALAWLGRSIPSVSRPLVPSPSGAKAMATSSTTDESLFERYRELQSYVGWNDEHAAAIRSIANLFVPRLPDLIDDFYDEIQRHPRAMRVFTGGLAQIERLKGLLIQWLKELLYGPYDAAYVERRWRVGYRHVEIGLEQVYTNVALSRLRQGLHRILAEEWTGPASELLATQSALDMLLDLDLAIVEFAYQTEHFNREQQGERLAAIGQVAGGIAHELRNPMNVIKTSAYFLLNARDPTPEKVAEHLSRIELQVARADGVITALSNFARLPLQNVRPIPLETFLRETIADANLPRGIDVHLDCPASVAPARGDVEQLQIVLQNLIRNAKDAMPDGGLLTIRAHQEGDQVTIAVSDTGSGIEEGNLHRVMQPLFTTKARGIGLGLAMARAIVEKSDGSLSVMSRPEEGATFIIRLPAVNDTE